MKTKEEILEALRACAKKLGHNPSLHELRRLGGVNETELYRKIGNLRKALTAAGLAVTGSGFHVGASTLLLDWAVVTRKLGKIPTVNQYVKEGQYSTGPFQLRFERWSNIGAAFRKFAGAEKLERQWKDVLQMITAREESLTVDGRGRKRRKCPLLMDRPVYGEPLMMPELAYEPMNEAGVVFLFGALAQRLGFVVHRVQTEFPDCEAMRRMAKGQWQRVRIEFEFESRNFVTHKHDPKKCDLIVCWVHNWAECPLDVVELKGIVNQFTKALNSGIDN